MVEEYKVLLRSEVEPYGSIVSLIEDAGCQIVRWNPMEDAPPAEVLQTIEGAYNFGHFPFTDAYMDSMPDLRVCLLYTSPSPRDATLSRMPSSA